MPDRLEDDLRELGRQLEVRPAPDLSAAILTRIERERTAPRRRTGLRWLVVAAAMLLAATVTIAASPDVRAGIVQLLRFAGIEISVSSAPSSSPSLSPSPGAGALPGLRTVSLAEARREASFGLLVPSALGSPDTVELSDGTPPRVVSMHWDEGIRLDQFDGRLDIAFYKKQVGRGQMRWVTVDRSGDGVWIDGPHAVYYVGRDGTTYEESARLSAKTLIWLAPNGITYRLEGDRTLEQLTAVAASLRE